MPCKEFQTFVKTLPGDHHGQYFSIYVIKSEEHKKLVLTRGRALMSGIRVEGVILEEYRNDFFAEWFANSSGSTVFTNSDGITINGLTLCLVDEWKINQLHQLVRKFSSDEEFSDAFFRKGFALSLHDKYKEEFEAKKTAF